MNIKHLFCITTLLCCYGVAGAQSNTASFPIPNSVEFCGQEINLLRYDLRERYDREQLSFVYMHSNSIQLLKRANRYFPIIEPILKAEGVPDDLKYLCAIESNLNPVAYSPAKAAGLWQLMAATAQSYGLEVNDEIDERYHVEKATIAACQYLKDAYQRYADWPTTCASYNAGMNKITREITRQQVSSSLDMLLVSETSRYVFRILAAKNFFSYPQKFGFCLRKDDFYHTIRWREVVVNTSVENWVDWAASEGITYAVLRDFNPWIRSTTLHNKQGKIYVVRIPLQEDLHFAPDKIHIHNTSWIDN